MLSYFLLLDTPFILASTSFSRFLLPCKLLFCLLCWFLLLTLTSKCQNSQLSSNSLIFFSHSIWLYVSDLLPSPPLCIKTYTSNLASPFKCLMGFSNLTCLNQNFWLFPWPFPAPIFFFNFYFIHMCIQCLGPFSPLPTAPSLNPPSSLPYSPYPSLSGRNYFALISNFVEERV
jgi:hypothetical protein